MRWYDGFVLALANLAALIAVLGYCIGSLGGLGGSSADGGRRLGGSAPERTLGAAQDAAAHV